jgi:hypothetical protein
MVESILFLCLILVLVVATIFEKSIIEKYIPLVTYMFMAIIDIYNKVVTLELAIFYLILTYAAFWGTITSMPQAINFKRSKVNLSKLIKKITFTILMLIIFHPLLQLGKDELFVTINNKQILQSLSVLTCFALLNYIIKRQSEKT